MRLPASLRHPPRRLGLALAAGLCLGVAPSTQYTLGAGVVTDRDTRLMWQQTPAPSAKTYQEAAPYCAGLSLNGVSGWRLPTVAELLSIVDRSVSTGPAIDVTAFPGTPSQGFWTSTPCTGCAAGSVYVVNFGNGYLNVMSAGNLAGARVRCVRAVP